MINLQIFSEHLKLASHHLHWCFQQASMDGFGPVLFEVGTEDKSPIPQLTIKKAQEHFVRRCHGHVFREGKKFETN
jgi:hypothetical protein